MRYYVILALFLFSCKSQEIPESSLVIEAYIFENKPAENIKLNLVKPINTPSDLVAISDARVFIVWNKIYYQLYETANSGSYSADNDDLRILSGEHYELLVLYNNEEYRAETIVPATPKELKASKDSLHINPNSDFINITWENPDSLWYLGVIKDEKSSDTEFPFNNFFSIPTQALNLKITSNDVQSTGNKQFILYGITNDYEDLYRISSSTIGSSNAGNLSNGFGIFAAFSSDTLNFVVADN